MNNFQDNLDELMDKKQLQESFNILQKKIQNDPDVINFFKENQSELNDQSLEHSIIPLHEYIIERDRINKIDPNGEQDHYRPRLVLNNHLIDVEYVKKRPKTFSYQKMAKSIQDASIENYFQEDERAEALQKVVDFIKKYINNPHEFYRGLYLTGNFGVGKTYLLGALANELSKRGFAPILINFSSFALEMRDAISSNDMLTELSKVKQADVLIIDDLGADTLTSWTRDDVLGIILEYRMREELPTFITSNLTMETLEKEYLTTNQRGESEPLKAKRIMERIKFLTEEISMIGSNHRY